MELGSLAGCVFVVTVVLVLWRPGGTHQAVPALGGAFAMFLIGFVVRQDVLQVMGLVSNSAMTIISMFLIACVLDGAGFFDWAASRLIERAEGSSRRLFHVVLAFSVCLTLFLNNDGSILLGTPIVIGLVRKLHLPARTSFAYLISACLVASVASPLIDVSNLANLEAMGLVGISVLRHLEVVFVPGLLGLAACWGMLSLYFGRTVSVPLELKPAESVGQSHGPVQASHHLVPPPHRRRNVPPAPLHPRHGGPPWLHPPGSKVRPIRHPAPHGIPSRAKPADPFFMWFAVFVLVIVRLGFFVATNVGVRSYVLAVTGAATLMTVNFLRRAVDGRAALQEAPWPILGFAFGMDLVVFGLRNAGIIHLLGGWVRPLIMAHPLLTSVVPGALTTIVTALVNNHPGLIIGSLTLVNGTGLPPGSLDTAYASVVLGSDVGALLTPVGTLASLLWFHAIRQDDWHVTWWDYLKVALVVIPITLSIAILSLFTQMFLFGPHGKSTPSLQRIHPGDISNLGSPRIECSKRRM